MKGLVKINFFVCIAIFIISVEVVCEVGIVPKHQNVDKLKTSQHSSGETMSQSHINPSLRQQVLNQTQDQSIMTMPQLTKERYNGPNVVEEQTKNNSGRENTISNYSDKSNITLLMEGGGKETPDNLSFASPDTSNADSDKQEDGHASGSKGRKGVPQISSVVPRKGVLEDGGNKSASLDSAEHSSSSTLNSPSQSYKHPSLVAVHNKKPEYVSDKEDVDDFDKYSIIKTSTTGEDYVIIGIVIVIGIWFSVFGGLIFYRRAGEYWDRRHYRRMDFLVEGMYND